MVNKNNSKATAKTKKYIPEKGDFIWVEFNPTKGHEQSGYRPAIVITPYENNSVTGLAVVCPITSKVKKYIFEVAFNSTEISGAILVDQLRSIDIKNRKIKFIEKASNKTIADTVGKALALIGS
ncbi:hypothetical protein GW764_00525 [Candidatus Parcubacteria bacterium]|nr:hypothetical protein [Candidatus Parcubacteria bacterium]